MEEVFNFTAIEKILIVEEKNETSLKRIFQDKICFTNATAISDLNEKFDTIISSTLDTNDNVFNRELLMLFFTKLNAGGRIFLYLKTDNDSVKQLEQNLLISGFVDTTTAAVKSLEFKIEDLAVKNEFVGDVIRIRSEKPKYEIGSSKSISLPKSTENVSSVWKIDNEEDDYINADDLLEDEDIKRPDPASLKVCGTTGKRKACKDCSCGLAEELENEKKKDTSNAKSSCGNCYLGDAFRCASCPYLGLPAFKPGEKIQLSDEFLTADI